MTAAETEKNWVQPDLHTRVADAMLQHPKDSIITISGVPFSFSDPLTWRFNIRDMAHSLAKLSRYVGHTRRSYTVAEHLVWVSEYLEAEGYTRSTQFHGLVHDTPEAYTGDINSPLKSLLPDLERLEDRIFDGIYAGMGWPYPTPNAQKIVKTADRVALLTEYRDLKGGEDYDFLPRKVIHASGDPDHIEALFLGRYAQLTGRYA